MGIFSLGVIMIFVGAVLLAVASVTSSALSVIGGILLGIGLLLLLICMCFCAHAWCVWYVRDSETQTVEAMVVGADQIDGDWYPVWSASDKKTPNGVLRDGRQSNTLTKKHVTISPRSNDSFSSEYSKGVKGTATKTGPGSVSSDMSTLASFAYLNEPSQATPYGTLTQRGQTQQNVVQVPIQIQRGYGTVPGPADMGKSKGAHFQSDQGGHVVRSNVLPARRHSDDDYDNATEVVAMLPQQTYQPHWQHQFPATQFQPQPRQQGSYHQQWQHIPPQQTVWQYQPIVNQQQWRHVNPAFDEPPPPQPLVQPSQRRPMTFEQISSSKVSLYDNMQMGKRDDDE